MVEHRAQGVVEALVARGHLDGLGDRDAQRAGGVLGLRAAGVGGVAGRAQHARSPGLDHRAPVGLLVVARAHHVDGALEAEHRAGQRQRRAPLPGAGLGDQPAHAGLLVGVGLRDGAVGLVRARGGDALVLVEDLRRGIELGLEPLRAVQRRRAPQPQRVAHRLGDLDLRLGRDLLLDQRHREDRREVGRPGGLAGLRVQRRDGVARQVGQQVDPVGRDRRLGERDLHVAGHGRTLPRERRTSGRQGRIGARQTAAGHPGDQLVGRLLVGVGQVVVPRRRLRTATAAPTGSPRACGGRSSQLDLRPRRPLRLGPFTLRARPRPTPRVAVSRRLEALDGQARLAAAAASAPKHASQRDRASAAAQGACSGAGRCAWPRRCGWRLPRSGRAPAGW